MDESQAAQQQAVQINPASQQVQNTENIQLDQVMREAEQVRGSSII